jgi:hypothetical protein
LPNAPSGKLGNRPSENAGAAPADTSGYINVTADGGAALVLIDGLPRGFAPEVVSVRPGRHTVSVRSVAGSDSFAPRKSTMEVARGDTGRVVFVRVTRRTSP